MSFRSAAYWEQRYLQGRNSGAGSYGRLADFKAMIVNQIVERYRIRNALDLGCGDGAQASAFEIGAYVGVDVSSNAVQQCKKQLGARPNWQFFLASEREAWIRNYDMTLSLDVIYHLVEDDLFERYMTDLFDCCSQICVIYSSNCVDAWKSKHVLHREFSIWVKNKRPMWHLLERIQNPFPYSPSDPDRTSFADFYVYGRDLE